MAEMRVTKIDAARRQIDAAIRLLFNNEDPVAVHTLVGAGGRIVRDLCERSNTPGYKLTMSFIKPGRHKEFLAGLNKAANFLKHADTDADKVLERVQEEVNEHMIMLACMFYRDLGHIRTTTMGAFEAWYCALHPEVAEEGFFRALSNNPSAAAMREMNRLEQLEWGRD